MLRSFTLHPVSIVVGVVFSALVLLSMSQAPPLNARSINIQYMPNPRDMVTIRGGTPFVVPGGKLFVLTGIGNTYPNAVGCLLKVDGVPELQTEGVQLGATVYPVPPGFTVTGGSTIELCQPNGQPSDCQQTTPRAWGYLAPQ